MANSLSLASPYLYQSTVLLRPFRIVPRPLCLLLLYTLTALWSAQIRTLYASTSLAVQLVTLGGFLSPAASLGVMTAPLIESRWIHLLGLLIVTAAWLAPGPLTPSLVLGNVLSGVALPCLASLAPALLARLRKHLSKKTDAPAAAVPVATPGQYKSIFANVGGYAVKLEGELDPEEISEEYSAALVKDVRTRLDLAGYGNTVVAMDIHRGT